MKDSLGGNSCTTLICTASLRKLHSEETFQCLAFAQRAKSIKCKAKANVKRSAEELESIILSLKKEIGTLKTKLQSVGIVVDNKDDIPTKEELEDLGEDEDSSVSFKEK